MTRLNKYIAECGLCSRREADRYIDEGRVRINGEIAHSGMQVGDGDVVEVNNKVIKPQNEVTVLAYYKPIGVTCTEKDKHAKVTIKDALNYPTRLTYAGRLDKDSEGLILMTNDGNLIQQMMKGANAHEKEYIVKVNKEIDEGFVRAMSSGMHLDEIDMDTRPCEVEKLGKFTFRIVLTQGLNRQIRRMCQTLGYKVTSLKRVRVVNISLGKLKPGEYRKLAGEELKTLYEVVGSQKRGL